MFNSPSSSHHHFSRLGTRIFFWFVCFVGGRRHVGKSLLSKQGRRSNACAYSVKAPGTAALRSNGAAPSLGRRHMMAHGAGAAARKFQGHRTQTCIQRPGRVARMRCQPLSAWGEAGGRGGQGRSLAPSPRRRPRPTSQPLASSRADARGRAAPPAAARARRRVVDGDDDDD